MGAWLMLRTVGAGGVTLLEIVILALFAPTFAWIVIPFWTAVLGFGLRLAGLDPLTLRRGSSEAPAPSRSRTAIVVPVHNESPEAVAARISAMCSSLVATGFAHHFEVHLLSDTTDARIAEREEVEWVRLQAAHPDLPIRYRRRERNTGRKAGNIAEFCGRCADDYDFMVVLDADSIMAGRTLVGLAGLMEADPELGLVQTLPLPALQRTLFGRLIQFGAYLHGPVLAAGLSFWQADAGNYWGHNAIVRLRPFTDHCRLPVLPGRPPLGGEILSHDFVEAALLRRAGWRVVLVSDFEGSWEDVPGTVPDYAKRDRRWAQGSLQHLRLLAMPGLHPVSRLHFALGAMGYLSSLLWLLTLVAGSVYVLAPGLHGPVLFDGAVSGAMPGQGFVVSLLGVTAAILFLPKLLGVLDGLVHARHRWGGGVRLAAGALFETLASVLLAPIMMLRHARFVIAVVLGRSVRWEAQRRDAEGLSWSRAGRAAFGATTVGLAWGGMTLATSPSFFLWMSPIFLGLVLAWPLIRWTSSPSLGARVAALGLLRVPIEVAKPREIDDARRVLGRAQEDVREGVLAPPVLAGGGDPAQQYGVHRSPRTGTSFIAGRRMYNAERGLFDLRQGRPLLVTGGRSEGAMPDGDAMLVAVEGLTSDQLDRLRAVASEPPVLVVTGHRAAAMGLAVANGNGSSPRALAFPLPERVSLQRAVELSCAPAPLVGVSALERRSPRSAESAGLALVRLGRLLPSVMAFGVRRPYPAELSEALESGALLRVTAEEVESFVRSAGAEVVPISEAPVPLAEGTDSRFILFREAHGLLEHVAILVGDEADWPDPVPVRLHSACLTGDLFGSLRCDCGEQLRGSMDWFSANGGGVLLYLAQEGRGIGLRNKFRAYTLQESGLDTIEADNALGFGPDERRYDVAARILKMIGVDRIELLTNNPDKVRALENASIRVVRRRPLHGTLNRHNLPYVRTKVHRAGHWLGDMLSQPLQGD